VSVDLLFSTFDLEAFLDSSFEPGRLHYRPLTVGVEHEFFIERAGLPVKPSQSLQFFDALRAIGWTGPRAVPQESMELHPSFSPRTVIKYEHYPYLVEVAFDYFSNLHELAEVVEQVFCDLDRAGSGSNIDVCHRPFCSVAGDHPSTLAISDRARSLLDYREALLSAHGRTVPLELLNFSAVIAATQIHVGGIDWWSETGTIERLYSFEPDILALAYRNCYLQDVAVNPICRRWRGYRAVLGNLPLVGFPDLRGWCRESWIDALLCSPCLESPISEPGEFLQQVRDLQIIRPRLFGTLEFRADPAQNSARSILALAALRLAVSIAAASGIQVPGSMSEHRTRWWSMADDKATIPEKIDGLGTPLRQAGSWLSQRGMGEERYLTTLLDALAIAKVED
jgi:hypothetical protein